MFAIYLQKVNEHKSEKYIGFAQLTHFPSMFSVQVSISSPYLKRQSNVTVEYKGGEIFVLKHCTIWTNYFNDIW